jgi:hypothetical protein
MSGAQPSHGSNDKKVTVHFSAPDRWTFVEREIVMRKPGKLFLERAAGESWTFVSARVFDDTDDQFDVEDVKPGRIKIDNKCSKPRQPKRYRYQVVVELDGRQYASSVSARSGDEPLEPTPEPGEPGAGRVREPAFADPPPVVQNDPS